MSEGAEGLPAPVIELDGVCKRFGERLAVDEFGLAVPAGSGFVRLGPNGGGKTALLRTLAGLQAPTAGVARVLGLDVLGDTDEVRRHIGFGPDAPPAYEELTIDEFLTFISRAYGLPWSEASERIDHWLEQVWLTDKRDQKIGQLSRGMKQRVTIARTLIPNPAAVLLDVPASGLAPARRQHLRGAIPTLGSQWNAGVASPHTRLGRGPGPAAAWFGRGRRVR